MQIVWVQGNANIEVLYQIQKMLGFGHVYAQGERVSRLIVQKRCEIELLVLLFHGNLLLPTRKAQFSHFVAASGVIVRPVKEICPTPQTSISMDNLWLLGFVEAEGCFTISFLSNANSFRTRFIVSQKGDVNVPVLSQCLHLFGVGSIEAHSAKDNYSFIVSSLKNVLEVYKYFDTHLTMFVGKKKLSYLMWKEVNASIQKKQHLDPVLRTKLITKAQMINDIPRKFK